MGRYEDLCFVVYEHAADTIGSAVGIADEVYCRRLCNTSNGTLRFFGRVGSICLYSLGGGLIGTLKFEHFCARASAAADKIELVAPI